MAIHGVRLYVLALLVSGSKGSRRRPTMQRRIDMWDLGTVMAELVDLAPMLPGTGEIDQVALIIELPSGPPSEF